MQRMVAVGFGVALIFVGFWEMVYGAPLWMAWLNGVAGLVAFAGAGAFSGTPKLGAAIWGALALGLFVLWLAGLGVPRAAPAPWWSFGFACAFAALALSAVVTPTRATT
jgi:hypothetical protein